jgi:metal-responsive CopG/Arc/MetJ family transcriptional regulator
VKRTVYLPDDLATQVDAYLREHPGQSFSAVVQAALSDRLGPRDTRALLDLAGVVPRAAIHARNRAEDRPVRRER